MSTHSYPLCYSVPEAARALRISERTAWRLIKSGEIDVVRLHGRTLVTVRGLRVLLGEDG